jgi:hypothetical protein
MPVSTTCVLRRYESFRSLTSGCSPSGVASGTFYPANNADRIAQRIDDQFLRALVAQVTAGCGGKVALAPLLFLRELIDAMDRVDIHEDYEPTTHYRLELDDTKLTAGGTCGKARPLDGRNRKRARRRGGARRETEPAPRRIAHGCDREATSSSAARDRP